MKYPLRHTALVLIAAGLVLPAAMEAETVRIATWNLRASAEERDGAGPGTVPAAQVAETLKPLNTDIILLQGVQDWKTCGAIAEALKPASYAVVICSTFRDPATQKPGPDQVAILSRLKPYFSWSETAQPDNESPLPGGYAFAVLQAGDRRVGVFSVQCADRSTEGKASNPAGAGSALAHQILAQLATVTNWVANRPQAFAVGGSFNTRPGAANAQDAASNLLMEAGFADPLSAPEDSRKTLLSQRSGRQEAIVDRVLTLPGAAGSAAQNWRPAPSKNLPLVCDLEVDPARIALAVALHAQQQASKASLKSPPPSSATENTEVPARYLWMVAGGLLTLALLGAWWGLARQTRRARRAPHRLISDGPTLLSDSPYVVVAPRSTTASDDSSPASPLVQVEITGSTHSHSNLPLPHPRPTALEPETDQATLQSGLVANMATWLKQKLVQKLLTDRQDLLRTQQAATLKTLEVHQRLERIEARLREQDRAYEARLADLTRQLGSAREENRELIRARIVQVKNEMETARARMLSQAESGVGD